jgi:hypothetical protein
MWPFSRRVEVMQRSRPSWRDGLKCFREYDLPEGRTWESYRYLVEDIWVESAVDECVTDDPAERDRLVAAGLAEDYDMRVTDRVTGEVAYTKRPD